MMVDIPLVETLDEMKGLVTMVNLVLPDKLTEA